MAPVTLTARTETGGSPGSSGMGGVADWLHADAASANITIPASRFRILASAAELMIEHGYSQIPVTVDGRMVGSVNEGHLFDLIVKKPDLLRGPVAEIMEPAIPFADISTGVDALAGMLTAESPAVLVRDFKSDETYIITRWDVIQALS